MLEIVERPPGFFIQPGQYLDTLQTTAECGELLTRQVADALDVGCISRRFGDFVEEVIDEAWWNCWPVEQEWYKYNPFEVLHDHALFFVGDEASQVPVYILGPGEGVDDIRQQAIPSIAQTVRESGSYVLDKLQGIVLADAVEPLGEGTSAIPTVARCDMYERRIVIDPVGSEAERYVDRYGPFGIEPPMFPVLLRHELGHVLFGSDTTRVFGGVRGLSPTLYGDTNLEEDAAESYAVYGAAPLSLGTDRMRGVERILLERTRQGRPVTDLYVSPLLTGPDVVYPAFDLETVVDTLVARYGL